MKMVIMVLGVGCGGIGRMMGTVVLLPGAVISVLGAVIRKLKTGLFFARDGHGLAKGNERMALFTLLPFYCFTFRPLGWSQEDLTLLLR